MSPRPSSAPAGRPRRLDQRRLLLGLSVALAVLLSVLLYLLFGYLRTSGLNDRRVLAGIRVHLTIEGPGRGREPLFGRPMGVAVGKGRRIYVTDAENSRVCVFTERGRFLFEFGGLGVAKPLPGAPRTWRPGLLNYPVGIDTDEEGHVYVADFRNDQVQVFDPDGRFLRAFPDPRRPVGRGSSGQDAQGIAVTDIDVRDGKVFATDKYQVFVFSTEGHLLRQFGRPGRAEGDLDHPNGVQVDPHGRVYVSDSNHARVTAFSEDGSPLWTVGQVPSGLDEKDVGAFGLPRGLTLAGDDRLVIADAFNAQLVVLNLRGRVIGRYGSRGSDIGAFSFPNDVEVLRDRFVVADKDNERVQVVSLVGAGGSSRR